MSVHAAALIALGRGGLWGDVAHRILYEAVLANAADDGRRAVEAMRAPDVGELVVAHLHFYLADGDGRPVPFVEARGRATAAVAAAIPGAIEMRRDWSDILWKVPSLVDATLGIPSHPLRYDHVRMYTRQCRHHWVLPRAGLAEAALLARYHVHIRLEIDIVPPEPEAIGRLLADLTRAMHDCGAVRRGHAFRMCPTSLYDAQYRLSEASLATIDYVMPLLKNMRGFLETRPEDPDEPRRLLVVIWYGHPTPLLGSCPGGPASARDIIKLVKQKRLSKYVDLPRKILDEKETLKKWSKEDDHMQTVPTYY